MFTDSRPLTYPVLIFTVRNLTNAKTLSPALFSLGFYRASAPVPGRMKASDTLMILEALDPPFWISRFLKKLKN